MAESWCTIESDPGVFTELIQTIGVAGVQVEELYSLDEAEFAHHAPIYGLIFLFKYQADPDDPTRPQPVDYQNEPNLFFAEQRIPNACATQAILHVLLNTPSLNLGQILGEFVSFTRDFSPDLKGMAISNSGPIRESHNSFARQEPFVMEDTKTATKDDDVFHFIAYIPFNGTVYELDGLKSGPIPLGPLGDGEDWLSVARPAIQSRIERYASSEIRFNLMGILRNRKERFEEEKSVLEARKMVVEAALGGAEGMEVEGFDLATTPDGLQAQASEIDAKIGELEQEIKSEEAKFNNWRQENVRRKHNYIPFVVNLFRLLAERGHLKPMVEKAQAARREATASQAAAK